VSPPRTFRALSLDLWFTTLYYSPEREAQWPADRIRSLQENLRTRRGEPLTSSDIEAAMDQVHSRMRAGNSGPITVDPEETLRLYANALDAELPAALSSFSKAYSAVGLSEHPPIPNPEAVAVVRALTNRGVPVISITNTARRGATWHEFLRDHMGIDFSHIVSSADCGAAKPDLSIFQQAARTLGLAASEILHVGDRWELDVEGAQRAGFGAALYTGLWRRYPDGLYPPTKPALSDSTTVLRVENLEQLLDGDLFPTGR